MVFFQNALNDKTECYAFFYVFLINTTYDLIPLEAPHRQTWTNTDTHKGSALNAQQF